MYRASVVVFFFCTAGLTACGGEDSVVGGGGAGGAVAQGGEGGVGVTGGGGVGGAAGGLSIDPAELDWVEVANPGEFAMGSPVSELGRNPSMGTDETVHQVTLTHSFEILATEVTRELFESVLGFDPSTVVDCASDCPAHDVDWHMAAAFCNALSDAAGLATCYQCSGEQDDVVCSFDQTNGTPYDCVGYRLPTEAEWEYAARAGTATATYNGDLDVTSCAASTTLDPIAWHCGVTGGWTQGAPQPVASLQPNDLQLYDMLGNVLEHVHDTIATSSMGQPLEDATDPWGDAEGPYRLHRGGTWADDAEYSRAAWRGMMAPTEQYSTVGFRPARTLP